MKNDIYHPHYPSKDKDYYQRVMRLAGYLLRAKDIGLTNFFLCNKEHKRLVGYKDYDLEIIKV